MDKYVVVNESFLQTLIEISLDAEALITEIYEGMNGELLQYLYERYQKDQIVLKNIRKRSANRPIYEYFLDKITQKIENPPKVLDLEGNFSRLEKTKLCQKCGESKPLTTEFWYVQRSRAGHNKPGWQSHCRECWKQINRVNKTKRRLNGNI